MEYLQNPQSVMECGGILKVNQEVNRYDFLKALDPSNTSVIRKNLPTELSIGKKN